jgi:hypothetical protein
VPFGGLGTAAPWKLAPLHPCEGVTPVGYVRFLRLTTMNPKQSFDSVCSVFEHRLL